MKRARSSTDFAGLIESGKRMATGRGSAGSAQVLFAVPVESSGGEVVCTQPAKQVYLVTWTSGPDNRLTSSFCKAVTLALDIIEQRYEPGVVITTSGIPKFYSNGLDLDHVRATPGFFKNYMYPLWHRLLTYPMPTVALVNGHGFAGGFLVAMMHDYRIMNPHKGYLCMNENELGAPLRRPMASIFREKVSPQTYRKMILEAHRFKALEAMQEGVVDWLGGLEEALAHIDEFKLVQKSQKGVSGRVVYGHLKAEMWRETVNYLLEWSEDAMLWQQNEHQHDIETKKRERKVQEWEKSKAKL